MGQQAEQQAPERCRQAKEGHPEAVTRKVNNPASRSAGSARLRARASLMAPYRANPARAAISAAGNAANSDISVAPAIPSSRYSALPASAAT